jgi:PII-like signaling protein
MKGYQVTFFTVKDHKHHGHQLGPWLLTLARDMGLPGATLVAGFEGFGHHRQVHSLHFIETSDPPIEVQMVLTEADCERLFERLTAEGLKIFYVKTPVEFGMLGESQA